MFLWRKSARREWLAPRTADLELLGAATIERPGRERVVVEVYCQRRQDAEALVSRFGGAVRKIEATTQQKWLRGPVTPPLRISSCLIVVGGPRSRDAPPRATRAGPDRSTGISGQAASPRLLVIPAEAAFGTGQHATTAMCLRLLERVSRKLSDWSLLDVGTGSGILALAGKLFGSTHVLGLDTDPVAIRTAQRNAKRNRISAVDFVVADITKAFAVPRDIDVIIANLFSEVIITSLPRFRDILPPAGVLILSGILREQEREVLRAVRRHGFCAEQAQRRGKWIAMVASKRAGN